jgi:hypothetical protein
MLKENEEAIRQIDEVLATYGKVEEEWSRGHERDHDFPDPTYIKAPEQKVAELVTLMSATITRLATNGMEYAGPALKRLGPAVLESSSRHLKTLAGVLGALRADYQHGRLKKFREMVRSDVFSDFLEMAEYLLRDEGLKDPAAVMAGGVLEQHIRKLCDKHAVARTRTDPKTRDEIPLKLDAMNGALAKAGVYGSNDQKQVTAWAGIRNDAAHANYEKYSKEQVVLMVQGIRDFITRNPA